jgi:hypothetical protein
LFVKLGLAFLGVLTALTNKRRELSFLLAWIVLPFALFILSKSPVIYLPADNKFIFTLPVLFLLLAKGVTGLSFALEKNEKVGLDEGRLRFVFRQQAHFQGSFGQGPDQGLRCQSPDRLEAHLSAHYRRL